MGVRTVFHFVKETIKRVGGRRRVARLTPSGSCLLFCGRAVRRLLGHADCRSKGAIWSTSAFGMGTVSRRLRGASAGSQVTASCLGAPLARATKTGKRGARLAVLRAGTEGKPVSTLAISRRLKVA